MFNTYLSYVNLSIPESLGWRFAIFIVGALLLTYLVDLFLRKLLGLEKRSHFKSNYVNDRHKKSAFYLRVGGAIVLVPVLSFSYNNGLMYSILGIISVGLVNMLYQAYMEKRYAENPKDALYAVLEFPLTIIPLLMMAGVLFTDIPLYG